MRPAFCAAGPVAGTWAPQGNLTARGGGSPNVTCLLLFLVWQARVTCRPAARCSPSPPSSQRCCRAKSVAQLGPRAERDSLVLVVPLEECQCTAPWAAMVQYATARLWTIGITGARRKRAGDVGRVQGTWSSTGTVAVDRYLSPLEPPGGGSRGDSEQCLGKQSRGALEIQHVQAQNPRVRSTLRRRAPPFLFARWDPLPLEPRVTA